MKSFTFNTFQEAAPRLAQYLIDDGSEVSTPRTGEFLEARNLVYTIKNPTDRLINFEHLKQVKLWSINEIMTEFLSLNPPLTEQYTNTETKQFMDKFHRGDGRHNYIYGTRWQNSQQFQRIVKRLQDDRYSRQAIMEIWDSSLDLNSDETNVPCTIIHQFLIRKNAVGVDEFYTNVYIRSNDFMKGFKYDIFLNSFIHEAFAGFLNCQVGELTFMVGSFHTYKPDYSKLSQIVNEFNNPNPIQQPRFSLLFTELYEQLWIVKHLEEKSRYTKLIYENEASLLHPLFKDWAMTYMKYNSKRG